MFPVVASSKVEALDPVSRKDDVPMTPNLLTDSPITPLLHGDVVKPLNGFSALKLGHPFKGSLKKSRQTAFVAPSFQDNESMKASVHDVEGPDPIQPEKRSIKWLDNHGKELIEVKEFEPRNLSCNQPWRVRVSREGHDQLGAIHVCLLMQSFHSRVRGF